MPQFRVTAYLTRHQESDLDRGKPETSDLLLKLQTP